MPRLHHTIIEQVLTKLREACSRPEHACANPDGSSTERCQISGAKSLEKSPRKRTKPLSINQMVTEHAVNVQCGRSHLRKESLAAYRPAEGQPVCP